MCLPVPKPHLSFLHYLNIILLIGQLFLLEPVSETGLHTMGPSPALLSWPRITSAPKFPTPLHPYPPGLPCGASLSQAAVSALLTAWMSQRDHGACHHVHISACVRVC